MTDDEERVDWSALMDAHGIEPDADTASPAVEPARRESRGRLVHVVVAVTALFSVAASAAVLIAILRGGDGAGGAKRAAAEKPMVPVGPRPAAFEQTTDGVTVVPPAAGESPPPAAESPPPAATAAPPEPPDPTLPDQPDPAGIAAAMAALEKDIAACAAPAGVTGEVGIKMRVEPDGKVAWASAKVQNSPFQACLDRLFKKARMPKSARGATVRQTVQLP